MTTVVGWALAGTVLLWLAVAVPAAVVVGRAIAHARRVEENQCCPVHPEEDR